MAKPDWAALQHQFLVDHAKTGISPKEWCEAGRLINTSARLVEEWTDPIQVDDPVLSITQHNRYSFSFGGSCYAIQPVTGRRPC